MLYACSNRVVRLFHLCSRNILTTLGRSCVVHFTVVICYAHSTTKHHFLKFVSRHSNTVILEAQPEGLSGKTKGNRLLRPCTVLPRIQRHCLAPPPKVQLR